MPSVENKARWRCSFCCGDVMSCSEMGGIKCLKMNMARQKKHNQNKIKVKNMKIDFFC